MASRDKQELEELILMCDPEETVSEGRYERLRNGLPKCRNHLGSWTGLKTRKDAGEYSIYVVA